MVQQHSQGWGWQGQSYQRSQGFDPCSLCFFPMMVGLTIIPQIHQSPCGFKLSRARGGDEYEMISLWKNKDWFLTLKVSTRESRTVLGSDQLWSKHRYPLSMNSIITGFPKNTLAVFQQDALKMVCLPWRWNQPSGVRESWRSVCPHPSEILLLCFRQQKPRECWSCVLLCFLEGFLTQ